MKTITVNVTQAHITAGIPGSSKRCPIALALVEALAFHYPFQPVVEVGGRIARLLNPGDESDYMRIELSPECRDFQFNFDHYPELGTPFTFDITLP